MTEIDPNQIQSTASTAASAAGSTSGAQETPKEEENYFVEEQKKAEEQAQEQARAEEQTQEEADRQAAQEALEQAQKEAEEAARKAAEEAARKAAEEKAKKEAQEAARKAAEETAQKEAQEVAGAQKKEEIEEAAEQKNPQKQSVEDRLAKQISDMDEATRAVLEKFLDDETAELDISDLNGKELTDLLSSFQSLKMSSLGEDWVSDAKFVSSDDNTVQSMVDKITQSYNDGEISLDDANIALASIRFTMQKTEDTPSAEEIKDMASEKLGDDFDFTKYNTYSNYVFPAHEPKEVEEHHFESMDEVFKLYPNQASIDAHKALYADMTEESEAILLEMLNDPSSLDKYIDKLDNKQASLIARAYENIKYVTSSDFGQISEEAQTKLAQKTAQAAENGEIDERQATAALIGTANAGNKNGEEVYNIASEKTDKISKDTYNTTYSTAKAESGSSKTVYKYKNSNNTYIYSTIYNRSSNIVAKASTTLSNILKSINNGTYKSNITSRYNSISSNSNNSKKSSVIGKAAGSIKSILKSGIDSIKNFVKNSSTKKSTDTKAEAANNKIDTKNIKAKTSYSPKTGNQNLGDLSTNKEQLEGSIESTQNALESVQDGNNELMQSAEQNLQDSIDAYKDALNFKDSEMYQEMQDAIDAFDESISQENQNILQCQEGIRDIDNNISLQAKGITKLDDAIRGYQSNIDALQSQLRSVRGTDAEREINKSIEKLESLKKAAQKQQDIMEENCQELTSQRKVLNDKILESRSNIKKFNDDKLNMKNKMESIGNELVQNAQKNLSLSKEYLDNTRRQISQQLEAQIADYESQLSNVEDKITDFGQNLSGVADNKDKTDEAIKAAQSPDDISKQNALQNSKMNNIYTEQPDTPSQSSVNNNATIQNPNNTGFSYGSAMQIDKNIASDLSANIDSAEDIQHSVSAVRDTISYESIGLSDIQKDMANNAIVFGELAQEQMKLRQTDISELSQDEARELKNKLDDIENKIDDLIQKQNELAAKEELQRKILARQQVNEESLKARYSDLYVQNQVSYDALAQEARKQKKNKENKEAQ